MNELMWIKIQYGEYAIVEFAILNIERMAGDDCYLMEIVDGLGINDTCRFKTTKCQFTMEKAKDFLIRQYQTMLIKEAERMAKVLWKK